jgi:hypothetical protein
MKIVRVYSGDDGESHFEDLTPDQFAKLVFPIGKGDITLGQRESPTFSDYHIAPRRQYVVNLAGAAEFEVADGTKVQMGPGDVLVAEDITGHGHIARGVGTEMRVTLAVPLSD